MSRLSELQELYDYDAWANRRVREAAARLTPEQWTRELGGSFPTVRDTLAHILAAEWIWLARWRGTSPTGWPAEWDVSDPAKLEARWTEVERDLAGFVAGVGEDDLDRVLAYRSTKGEPFVSPLHQMLRHVVNHSTYHRGQVVHMLRQLGAEAVSTDLILFYRERAATTPAAG
ncbi:MAG TPA: DinB family protein [Longimicrobiaceae bacterium]|nr:DinB family protein [Longimicrobiaceae bacterium]